MSLNEPLTLLATPAEVDAWLVRHPDSALLKLGTCHKNDVALAHARGHLDGRADIPFAIIHVVEARAASNRVAELTGVRHESPQLFFFKEGRAVFDRDNWDITSETVAEGLRLHFAAAAQRA